MARGSRKRTAGDTPGRAPSGDTPRKSRRGSPKVVPLPRGRSGKPRLAPRASRQAGRTVGRRRLRLVAGAVALVCVSLGGRAVHLSVESDARLTAAFASEQRLVAAEDRLERGAILSADGRRLATSLDAAEVVATPYQIEDAQANARALAGVLDLDATEIESKLTKRDGGGAPS